MSTTGTATTTPLQDDASGCSDYTNAPILYQDPRWKAAAIVAFVLGAFAVVVSMLLVVQHWRSYTQPRFQKPITRILLMIPIFAVCSFFSFYSLKSSVYLEIISKCYESFVVWSFFQLILEYVGDGEGARRAILINIPDSKLPPPVCWKPNRPSSPQFLWYCKVGILQYIIVNVTLSFVSLIAEAMGKFCEQSSSPRTVSVYVQVLMGASVGLAMFTLFSFYLPLHSRLHDIKPSPVTQFIAVKFVIFFQFWLTFFIKSLIYGGVIRGNSTWTAREFGTELQSFIVLCEMGIAALLHIWCFSASIYAPTPDHPVLDWKKGVYDTFSYFDIVHDVHNVSVGVHNALERVGTIRASRRGTNNRSAEKLSAVVVSSQDALAPNATVEAEPVPMPAMGTAST